MVKRKSVIPILIMVIILFTMIFAASNINAKTKIIKPKIESWHVAHINKGQDNINIRYSKSTYKKFNGKNIKYKFTFVTKKRNITTKWIGTKQTVNYTRTLIKSIPVKYSSKMSLGCAENSIYSIKIKIGKTESAWKQQDLMVK